MVKSRMKFFEEQAAASTLPPAEKTKASIKKQLTAGNPIDPASIDWDRVSVDKLVAAVRDVLGPFKEEKVMPFDDETEKLMQAVKKVLGP